MPDYLISFEDLVSNYYDPASEVSVISFAKKLVKTSLREHLSQEQVEEALRKSGKGWFGSFLEENYFYIVNNNESRPDIPESGIEIKSSQLKSLVRGNRKVFKERLKVSMIDFDGGFDYDSLTQSSLWTKLEKILLILFEHTKQHRIDQRCLWADLLAWEPEDIKQMSEDWLLIKQTISMGKADQLSEGLTWYLGASTAGSSSADTRNIASGQSVRRRAFSLKPSFLNYKLGLGPLPKGPRAVIVPSANMSIEEYIVSNMGHYFDRDIGSIASTLNRPKLSESIAKNRNSLIARALLEEIQNLSTPEINTQFVQFRKAGIIQKTVTLEVNGKLKESVSFPAIDWIEILDEESWDESSLYETLTSKFFFTVLQKRNYGSPILVGCFFWSMPANDLERMGDLWSDTKEKVMHADFENFISKAQHDIGHVRPHGQDAEDMAPTAGGGEAKKKSFWLNNTYIRKVIAENLR